MFGLEIFLTLFLFVLAVLSIYILFRRSRIKKKKNVKNKLELKSNEIKQAHKELMTLWNKDKYLEQRTINHWSKKWSYLESIINDCMKYKISNLIVNNEIAILFSVFKKTEENVSVRNEDFIQKEEKKYRDLFNRIEKYPLTQGQTRSIITDEFVNLVVAGAGTGKTSTIVGKTAYILKKGLAKPNELLLLSFARDAKQEMDKRIKNCLNLKLNVKTFHSLGLGIISEVEGNQPSVSILSTDKVKLIAKIEDFIRENLRDKLFSKLLNEYFLFHLNPYKSIFHFKNMGEYIDYLKKNEVRSLKGDKVKSLEECEIANFLYVNGVEYEYEKDYEVKTSTRKHRQYKPDFFLPKYGLYIEHFAINEKGVPPSFINKVRYVEGMEWKRQLHESNQTQLIETYSYEKAKGKLLKNLENKLKSFNVEFNRIPEEKIFEEINKLGYINSFASLVAVFLNLYKSSNMSINDLKEKAKTSEAKERSQAFVEVFSFIIKAYNNYLISLGEVDFNDMISLSEKYLRKNQYISNYQYLLVDEFQDISQSRYRLLKALLKQNPDCKLFCVGDDWQSIYRFTGSDVSLMRDFQKHFGYSKLLFLDKTFRFNDKICDFTSKFIMQNPNQIPKKLETVESSEKQTVKVIISNDETGTIQKTLEEINARTLKKTEVFIIGRYNYQCPDNLIDLKERYPRLIIKFITAHKSKGTEADYVILIGMKSGKYGFPCQIADDHLLDLVLSEEDNFPNSEERRLFYVAVTRARKEAYLISDNNSVSQFITEVLTKDYDVKGYGEALGKIRCPECKTGYVEIVNGKYGPFYSCSNYPYCEYRPQVSRARVKPYTHS